ncbi:MAG: hypothetical protein R3B70_21725 [Polyangiaceae bacterium]
MRFKGAVRYEVPERIIRERREPLARREQLSHHALKLVTQRSNIPVRQLRTTQYSLHLRNPWHDHGVDVLAVERKMPWRVELQDTLDRVPRPLVASPRIGPPLLDTARRCDAPELDEQHRVQRRIRIIGIEEERFFVPRR